VSSGEPTTEDLAKLIMASSSPLAAMTMVLSAYPEERRNSLALELHGLCKEHLLRDSLRLYEKSKANE
jgi:hypothetical protein